MRIFKSKIYWGVFILLLNCSSQTDVPPEIRSTAETISADYIAEQIRMLSHDNLEGRGIGTRGGRAAAEYIRGQMKALDMEPSFPGGGYFQPVSLVNMRTIPDQSEFSFSPDGNTIQSQFADDYIGIANCQLNEIAFSGKPVFVGYGIHAPEYGWNDYKDLDCTGKILIGFMNEPPSDDDDFFDGERLTYYGRWSYKYEEGARRGAKAVILIHTDETAGYGWRVISNSNISGRPLIDNEKHDNPVLDATYFITGDLGSKIFSSAGLEFDALFEKAAQPDFEPIELDTKLSLSLTSEKTAIATQNVVAKITGSDPQLKNETVIFTAHYDHLGIGKPVNGDSIYNGANDNASGVAMMLAVAKAMSSLEQKPARSIYFAAVGAEEALLLGSEYLAQHPPI
ncbi:M28 family peptidase, partial [candidate division KSB1 bacterium]|nr:M28 family peptidase [candidate division KSB1 bacterium]